MTKAVCLENAYLGYGKTNVLSNINICIHSGEYWTVVGTNGCGKSTLLKSIMGIIQPLRGNISLSSKCKISYVPQNTQLDPLFPLTVYEVVQMGIYGQLGIIKRLRRKHHEVICAAIHSVCLQEKTHSLFRNLSGGQRQKALIARALVSKPNCLILDEPTSGIDIPSQREILHFVKKLHQVDQATVIMVTHNLSIVNKYAQNVAIIHNGHIECGTQKTMMTPQKLEQIYGCSITMDRQ